MAIIPLYSAIDKMDSNNGWGMIGHRFLTCGMRAGAAGTAGLFDGGVAALGAAAASLRGDTGRYERLLGRIDAAVGPVADHDLISGTAGAGLYLLLRPPMSKRDEVASALAGGAGARPPYPMRHVPAAWQVADGYADCGLAHGAAGPLAVLALLCTDRPAGAAPEESRAIRTVADWLLGLAREDRWGTAWPAGVDRVTWHPSPRRAAWCYGVPGIARALRLAGDALCEPRYQRAADDAMAQLLQAPESWGLEGPGVCHGLAGLMLITAAFATHPRDRFALAVEDLFDRLCDAYDSRLPLGFDVTGPGLLSGAAGIALALLVVTGGDPIASKLFLAG
nr:lanthionine synthetase LanC family protein [Nonomuraea basaltis]